MSRCDWCKKESDKLEKINSLGKEYNICDKCRKAVEEDVCIECGEPLYGEIAIKGICSTCQQLKMANEEKKRAEIMNGLGLDAIESMATYITFTEEDYEEWVTCSYGLVSPELIRNNRKRWLRSKLLSSGWKESDFTENEEDIMYIFENYSHKIFRSTYKFVLFDGETKFNGIEIIERKGKVAVVSE